MRVIFLLILLAGLAAGFGYPWWVTNVSGHEIGSYPAYAAGAFRPVTVPLTSAEEPVRVLVDLTAIAPPEFRDAGTVLTLTASAGGRTVLAETLSFHEAKPQEKSPQLREKVYRDEAGVIADVEDGDYSFVIGQGDAEGIQIKAVDLVLRGGAGTVDPRAQPVGYAASAIGFIGLVLSLRRRRERNPDSGPPAPRWGRGGGQPNP